MTEEYLVEGLAKIHNEGNKVFYNPAQIVNRDLSVACIHTYRKDLQEIWEKKEQIRHNKAKKYNEDAKLEKWPGFKIFEALSASGLRSIRYMKEIPDISKIIVNDLDKNAVESIKANIKLNKLPTDKGNIVLWSTRFIDSTFLFD